MTGDNVTAFRGLDAAKGALAIVACVLFAGSASRLLGMLVPEPPGAVAAMATSTAAVVAIVSGLMIWVAFRSLVRSLTERAGGDALNPRSVGHGLTVLAWLPFVLFTPVLAVLGPNGRLATYPGAFVVVVAVSVLPAALAASGWAAATVATAVAWLTITGAAFSVAPPLPDVALTLLAVTGWTAFGVLSHRRSVPERRTRGARRRAVEVELRAARRREGEKRAEDERRRCRHTVRIPAHKGRKGLSVDIDRRRWVVAPAAQDDDGPGGADVEVGRVVLEHRCEQEVSPLTVSVEVRRSRGEAASTLRALSGIDDAGAVGPSVPEVHRIDRFGDVLCALVRLPDDEVSGEQSVRSVLSYTWRVGAHVSDVRVQAWSHDEQRVLAAVDDLDALVAAVRFP